VVLSVNISPYAVGILQNFTPFGINPSRTVDWLMQVYSNTNWIKVKEPKAPKIKREKKAKSSEVTQKQAYTEKKPFVHVSNGSPIVKKVKVKPTNG
jgi:hypothetical protein